jgi:HK97 family phage major capsid protein
MNEINQRLSEIEKELRENENCDVESLEKEVEELEERKNSLIKKAEERNKTLQRVLNTSKGEFNEEVEERKVENKMEEQNIFSTAEYRSGYLKKLQGKKLTDVEERALTSASNSVGAAIPTTTQDLVMERLEQSAPLLQEIELLRVDGNVTFAVEADRTDANIHQEGATITEDNDVLIPVSLTQYEITKYITISKTVSKMSIDAFEKWLANMLAERIARKIVKLIIAGTGSDQPKGVGAIKFDTTNSVTVGASASLTEKNVTDLTALLPGAYDKNAKWLMSKKTLLGDFRPLQDKSKNDIFVKDNGKYYVEGYEVMLDDSVELHEAYFGNFKMYVGNLGEDVTVDTDKKLSSNSFEYLGCAMFDGKPAIDEAFVKLVKASA